MGKEGLLQFLTGLVAENTINTTSRARHGGIEGSFVIKALLDVGNGGVEGEHALLKVIEDILRPFLYGTHDAFVQMVLGLLRMDKAVGLACGNKIVRFYEQQPQAAQGKTNWRELIANTCCEDGLTANEEGTIGTKGS